MTGPSSPARPLAEASLAAGLIALAMFLQFVSSSWLWPLMQDSGVFRSKGKDTYKQAWTGSGYRGLPIEELATALNAKLPVETPIKLAPGFDPQWAQRVKEGLYPRRVQPEAAFTLEMKAGQGLIPTPRGPIILTGKLPPPPAKPVPGKADFGISWMRILVHLGAALGWGLALAVALGRRWRAAPSPVPLLPAATLAAPVFYGVLGTVATLVQKPLPWTVLTATGLALLPAALMVSFWKRPPAEELRARLAWVRHPECWAMIVFSAALIRHMDLWPIIGWDGRSIWLYRAKQVLWNGFLTIADAVNPENFFSHMEYPLLYPTWMAHFASSGPVREREIAVGVMLLQVFLTITVWWLSRRRLGRWTGAAFAGAVYVVCAGMSERGFADGFLTMFLVLMGFLLESEELEPFGWVAALGAALTKGEGLIFASMMAGLFLLFHPRFRAKPWLPRLLPLVGLPLAAAPAIWAKVIAIKSQYAGAKLPATSTMALHRLEIIWNGIVKLARESNPVAYILGALAMYLVLEYLGRRSWLSRILAVTALGIAAFSAAVLMVTPYDLAEQVGTAMSRLLQHSVFVLAAAVLAALTSREAAPGPAPPRPG
jgi:hypothetical protein